MGVKLALDDFGTGYANLSHLLVLPLQMLKLDRSFVYDVDIRQDHKFLKALARFAQSLGFETIAEGVETAEHHELCRSLGIPLLQGYFIDEPKTSEAFAKKWLRGQESADQSDVAG